MGNNFNQKDFSNFRKIKLDLDKRSSFLRALWGKAPAMNF